MSISDLLARPGRVGALPPSRHPKRASGHGQPAVGDEARRATGRPSRRGCRRWRSSARSRPHAWSRRRNGSPLEAPSEGGLPLALLPVVDGVLLERPPGELIVEGAAASVPVLVGTTRDECALFTTADHGDPAVDDARVAHRLARARGPGRCGRRRCVSPRSSGPRRSRHRPRPVDRGHHRLRVPAAAARRSPPRTPSISPRPTPTSSHGSHLSSAGCSVRVTGSRSPSCSGPCTTRPCSRSRAAARRRRCCPSRCRHAWIAFARDGDPSCDAVGSWPAYDPVRRTTMVLGPGGGVEDDPRRPERLVWDETGTAPMVGHHHE